MHKLYKVFFIYLILSSLHLQLASQVTLVNPMSDMKLLEQFQDAKLGLFVHWMACHSPGTGDSWNIGRGKTKTQADSITLHWNPVNFNAKEIVDVAVKGGCKYMVVISKHHDGFCIWPSSYSVFDIDRIPFKRDILKELGDECRKQGLLFGIYYSIADIDYCGWKRMPELGQEVETPRFGKEDFVQFVHNQTKELITRYNPDILWFDGHWLDPVWGPQEGRELYRFVKSVDKHILSTRLSITRGADGQETFWTDGASGDYFSMEAKTTKGPAFPWEACTSVTYPVYAYEPNAKMLTCEELLNMFSKTLCGNGNLLVNIGPKPDGSMPAEQVARLHEFSQWVARNEKAVYETKGGPYKQTDNIGSTYAGNVIYLHLRNVPDDLEIAALKGYRLKDVQHLSTGTDLKFEANANVWNINVSPLKEEEAIPVIALILDKDYKFTDWLPLSE